MQYSLQVTPAMSASLVGALRQGGLLDAKGLLKVPRHTSTCYESSLL